MFNRFTNTIHTDKLILLEGVRLVKVLDKNEARINACPARLPW